LAELNGTQDTFGTDTQLLGSIAGGASGELGELHHVVVGFTGSNTVDAGDTFTLDSENDVAIVRAAWEIETGSGAGSIQINSAKAVGFLAGSSANGFLHLWLTG
jgi:hypothetical protein